MTIGDDDPFGLMNDRGRTRIRPTRAPSPDPGGPTRHDRTPEPIRADLGVLSRDRGPETPLSRPGRARVRAHPNRLIACFASLLELAPELERAASPSSPETLRVKLLHDLVGARDAAVAGGAALARADQAAWFVAALIDDLAINTPWGAHGDWPRQPLVVSLVGEVDPGSRFFDHLAQLQRHPERDREMLELATTCLALGFRGRYRVEGPQAQGALMQARATSARLLRDPEAERAPLSPRWEGVAAPDAPSRFAVPLWTIGLAALALVLAIHVGLGMRLSAEARELYAVAGSLPPPVPAAVVRPERDVLPGEPPQEPPPLPQSLSVLLQPEFEAAAPAEVRSALTGREGNSALVLTVRGSEPEVFRSAKADLNDVYAPLIASIGATIAANMDVIGGVKVIGHTDSVPVQASNPFATNQGLSEARARTIAALLAQAGVPEALIRSEGRADSDPVSDNATREGQALNRRVEIRIEKVF